MRAGKQSEILYANPFLLRIGGPILTFTAPFLRYGIVEDFLGSWVIEVFCKDLRPFSACSRTLLPRHYGLEMGLHTQVHIYDLDATRYTWLLHAFRLQPFGIRITDPHHSSLLQCGKCGAIRSWHFEGKSLPVNTVTATCAASINNPFDGEVRFSAYSLHNFFAFVNIPLVSRQTIPMQCNYLR